MQWITVPQGSPAYHQAFEQVVFERVRGEDVLLLWRNPPAIVCGAYQNVYQETSVYRAWKQGVPVIRRASGGGTVYHDLGNLNYTVIQDSDGTVDYDKVMAGILTALRRLGIPAQKANACDITLHGKKISGSAQKISKGRLLHHGTLLFDTDLTALHGIADRAGRTYVSRAIPSRPAQVVNIGAYWQGDLEAFQKALKAAYPAQLTEGTLTPEQLAEAERLAEEKYSDWAWTCGKSPAFRCEASGQVAGQPVTLAYEAKKGIVTYCQLQSPGLAPETGARFLGARLHPEEIEDLCRGITPCPEQLSELIL